ncbi:MAG TPA: hypothetical protein VFA18_01070, partial [Gemmataceae bacterium]|nr:hypothetical protein [Gemmataceae bacterium]
RGLLQGWDDSPCSRTCGGYSSNPIGPADDAMLHVQMAKIDEQGKTQSLEHPDLIASRGTAYVVFQPRQPGQYRVEAYYFYMSGRQQLGTWDITVSI